ncbi:aldolase [Aureobasidium pullulans]|nr:aldolase [Aureobasidium pullulans]THY02985.1 aldolase [Aureobasidium pullulans]
MASPPPPGIWSPAVTFYNPATGQLDLESQEKYNYYLSKSGLSGLVILGTNGEAFLLTREERARLISNARKAVGPDFPLMASVSAFSTIQVLEYIDDAYKAATTPAVISDFFAWVAEKSPLPIIIYNAPAVCNGIDLDSETITAITEQANGKILGVKLTCGSVGKISRLSASLPSSTFSILGGQSDFLVGGLATGSAGCISAFANVFPKTVVHIYKLFTSGKQQEALELQRKAALAESPCKAGIASTKFAVAVYSAVEAGVQDAEEKLKPRKPYAVASEEVKRNIRELMAGIAKVETSL